MRQPVGITAMFNGFRGKSTYSIGPIMPMLPDESIIPAHSPRSRLPQSASCPFPASPSHDLRLAHFSACLASPWHRLPCRGVC